jgi:hypothetical protein
VRLRKEREKEKREKRKKERERERDDVQNRKIKELTHAQNQFEFSV